MRTRACFLHLLSIKIACCITRCLYKICEQHHSTHALTVNLELSNSPR